MLKGSESITETQLHKFKTDHIDAYVDIILDSLDGTPQERAEKLKALLALTMKPSTEYDPTQRKQRIEEDAGFYDVYLYSEMVSMLKIEKEGAVKYIYQSLAKLLHELRWNKTPGSASQEMLNRYASATAINSRELYQNYQQITPNIAQRLSPLGTMLDSQMIENAYLDIVKKTQAEKLQALKKEETLLSDATLAPSKPLPVSSSAAPSSHPSSSDDSASPSKAPESKKRKKPSESFDPVLEQLREIGAETMSDEDLARYLTGAAPVLTPGFEKERKKTVIDLTQTQEESDLAFAIQLQEEENKRSLSASASEIPRY